MTAEYIEFIQRFKLLASKRHDLIVNTLSNIFTMRLIGNKTHGDLAEIAIVEFVNQFMYDYTSQHVGKDRFRSKTHEEDIVVINELTKRACDISLKAYGDGPLQLSTDSDQEMFNLLRNKVVGMVDDRSVLNEIFRSAPFVPFHSINIMPLIYREKDECCNIMIFNSKKAEERTKRVVYIGVNQQWNKQRNEVVEAKARKHPIYLFLDENGDYICEVRYGGASANALQRGLWTHTKNAVSYFDSITDGWVNYASNEVLVQLFRLALNATKEGHEKANELLRQDIARIVKEGVPYYEG